MKKLIKKKTVSETMFVSEDGKEFEYEEECIRYEKLLEYNKIDTSNFDTLSYTKDNHNIFVKFFTDNFIYNYHPANDTEFYIKDIKKSKSNILSYIIEYLSPKIRYLNHDIFLTNHQNGFGRGLSYQQRTERHNYNRLNISNSADMHKTDFYTKIVDYVFKDNFVNEKTVIEYFYVQRYRHHDDEYRVRNERTEFVDEYSTIVGNLLRIFIDNKDEKNLILLITRHSKILTNEKISNVISDNINFSLLLSDSLLEERHYNLFKIIFKLNLSFKFIDKTSINSIQIKTKIDENDNRFIKYSHKKETDIESGWDVESLKKYITNHPKISDDEKQKRLNLLNEIKSPELYNVIDLKTQENLNKKLFEQTLLSYIKKELEPFNSYITYEDNNTFEYIERFFAHIFVINKKNNDILKNISMDAIYLIKTKRKTPSECKFFEEKIIKMDFTKPFDFESDDAKKLLKDVINFITHNTPLDKKVLEEINTYTLQIKELENKISKLQNI